METEKTIRRAMAEHRAYITTYYGEKRRIVSYDFTNGDCVTNNTNDYYQQQTFMVSPTDIQIEVE